MGAASGRIRRGQDCLQPHPLCGGFLVTWLEDTSLRDLDDFVFIEATCLRCLYVCFKAPYSFLSRSIIATFTWTKSRKILLAQNGVPSCRCPTDTHQERGHEWVCRGNG